MGCATLIRSLLTGCLALIFITAGVVKLTPKLSEEVYEKMVCLLFNVQLVERLK